jgi:DNA-binding MarR family transcriptional regulator
MGLTLTEAKKRILAELYESPRHGYALSKELSVRGSTMYEHLDQLSENNYVESEQDGRRKVYSLTQKGELIVEAEQLN